MAVDDEGILGRWSRRKTEAARGTPPAEPDKPAAGAALGPRGEMPGQVPAPKPDQAQSQPDTQPAEQAAPLPTLDDVRKLALDGDFKPFVARGVPADVRNAALKKLFTDPRYNVMDGLDIYIDDYSIPSPLSAAAMAKMVSAQFMKLVDDPNKKRDVLKPIAQENETSAADETPTQPVPSAEQADGAATLRDSDDPAQPEETRDTEDDDADLQLQPNHATRRPAAGPGTG